MVSLVELSRSFSAMSTGIKAVVCVPVPQRSDAELSLDSVRNLFEETEQRCSRFLADSELSELNLSAGREFKASPLLYEVVAAAIASARLTGGIFDPSILGCLISAGYDRSFELLDTRRKTSVTNRNLPRHTWRDIRLNPEAFSILLPEGCGIDLGGIAKGWAADRAGRCLGKYVNYAVNAGGDIIVNGTQADTADWSIGIEDPRHRQDNIGILRLSGAAVCTTTTTQRRWRSGNIRKHHLIDPRTGLPAESGVLAATVIAGTAALAETISKAALILGPQDGLQLIEKHKPAEGMMVLKDGRQLVSPGFRKYCGPG